MTEEKNQLKSNGERYKKWGERERRGPERCEQLSGENMVSTNWRLGTDKRPNWFSSEWPGYQNRLRENMGENLSLSKNPRF